MATVSSSPQLNLTALQSLPQELQDEILLLVLYPLPAEVTITKTYRPPTGLHISRALRKKIAQTYYTDTTFVTGQVASHDEALQYFAKWLGSIPVRHKGWITKLALAVDFGESFSEDRPLSTMVSSGLVHGMRNHMAKQGVDIEGKQVEFRVVRSGR